MLLQNEFRTLVGGGERVLEKSVITSLRAQLSTGTINHITAPPAEQGAAPRGRESIPG